MRQPRSHNPLMSIKLVTINNLNQRQPLRMLNPIRNLPKQRLKKNLPRHPLPI
jgi:hypothetical protein